MSPQQAKQPRKTKWWWLRHAPTGLSGRIVGQTDVDAVIPDADSLDLIAGTLPAGATWLISSLRRCGQTAEAILARPGISALSQHTEHGIREQNFGRWENLSYDDPEVRHAKVFWDDPAHQAPPEGESFADLTKRVHRTIQQQLSLENAPENIIVIAHAGVIRAAIALALDLSPEQALRLQVDPLSLTRLNWFDTPENLQGFWSVECVNRLF